VADGGGPAEPRVIDDLGAEHGRGLLLVRGLAGQIGVSGDVDGRVVWADVAWHGREPRGDAELAGGGRAGVCEGEAART